ncbi:MAG TPA: DUF177 domain-containing protein [Methyloceanibacter sp.]|nr:DUF177 domain-containing protein [Methyloceanibacter sp.]
MRKMPRTAELGQELEIVPPPLTRTLRVDELKEGEERVIEVNRAERETIAALLDLRALDRLTFTFRLHRRGQGRLALQGTLAAAVTQTCVVSLEPVESTLDVPVEVEFWPVPMIDDLAASPDEAASHGTLDWPEPIEGGKIDLGPVIYETLATALDPYPKREGVSFEWSETPSTGAEPEQAESPFAALKRLK